MVKSTSATHSHMEALLLCNTHRFRAADCWRRNWCCDDYWLGVQAEQSIATRSRLFWSLTAATSEKISCSCYLWTAPRVNKQHAATFEHFWALIRRELHNAWCIRCCDHDDEEREEMIMIIPLWPSWSAEKELQLLVHMYLFDQRWGRGLGLGWCFCKGSSVSV